MAGSTFQPPIHLDPTQDEAQQVAFINQNFQSLAAVLQTNSLKITDQGKAIIPSTSHVTGSISSNDATVTLTQIYTSLPIVLSFIVGGFSSVDTIGTFWGTGAFVPLSFGGTPIVFTEGYVPKQIVSTSQIIFREQYINSTGSTNSNPTFTIQYFVIPQPT